jgi:putative endonuclease
MDNSSGPAGEDFAVDYLRSQNCEILRRNYHSRFGEIDIIARDGEYLAFVEVKTREVSSMVGPLEAVTAAKQRKIIRTALSYLQKYPQNLQPRFDIAAVTTKNGIPTTVCYLKNAFSGTGFI